MERNLIERLPFLKDVFVSIDDPLSAEALIEPPAEVPATNVLSTVVIVCWEKFVRYFDVEVKEVKFSEGFYSTVNGELEDVNRLNDLLVEKNTETGHIKELCLLCEWFTASILALQFCLGTCLDHLGRRHELGELWDCQLGNFTAGKDSGGGE
ncbi:glutamate decarboxylase [Tanacetum coccineum]